MQQLDQKGLEYFKRMCQGPLSLTINVLEEEWGCKMIFGIFQNIFEDFFTQKSCFLTSVIATSIFFGMTHAANPHNNRQAKLQQVANTTALGFMCTLLREKVGFLSATVGHTVMQLISCKHLLPNIVPMHNLFFGSFVQYFFPF